MADDTQIIAFPLDDTWYTASGLGCWHGGWTSGVFADDNHLPVQPAGGMNITLGSGLCNLKRDKYWSVSCLVPETLTFTLDRAHTSLPRYDAIVVRLNKNLEKPEVIYRPGTPSAKPSIPAITRGGLDADEIYPAAIYVRAGATQITAADITPLHLNETYCGIVRDGVYHIPTQQLYDTWWSWFSQLKIDAEEKAAAFIEWMSGFRQANEEQLAAWVLDFKTQHEADLEQWYTDFTASNTAKVKNWYDLFTAQTESEVRAWFQMLQDELDENQAVNLANKIYNHEKSDIIGDGVHGLRLKNGKLQANMGAGWATLLVVPAGWSANYIKASGYTWNQLKNNETTWEDLFTLIEVEAE